MTFRSFMTRTHRFLGALMSVLFVAWFVSGLVLIYHAYPKYSMDEELKHSTRLPESLPTTDSLHALFTSLQLDTVPLERYLGQISGLKQMSSASGAGVSVITLQFALDSDLGVAEQDVQSALDNAESLLPDGMPAPPRRPRRRRPSVIMSSRRPRP